MDRGSIILLVTEMIEGCEHTRNSGWVSPIVASIVDARERQAVHDSSVMMIAGCWLKRAESRILSLQAG